jgi:hypothetical protein
MPLVCWSSIIAPMPDGTLLNMVIGSFRNIFEKSAIVFVQKPNNLDEIAKDL